MDGRNRNSFLRGGYYGYDSGILGAMGGGGRYWEYKVVSVVYSWYLTFASTALSPQNTDVKGIGRLIRCVVQP